MESNGESGPLREPARPKPIIELLPYQREDVESQDRFRWNCWSRQTGKSFTKSLRRILRGLHRGRDQIFLSAGERQSRELMTKARQHCEALRIATEFHDSQFFQDMSIKQLEIVLPGGVRVIGLPANPRTARGFSGDVFLDEFAMQADDREIWAAMFPTLLRGGGELDVASTPKGKGNVFAQLRDNDRFATSVVTLPDAIEQGLDVDIDAIREGIGDDLIYRQEFLCEFVDESSAFLPYDLIKACCDSSLPRCETPADLDRESQTLYMGVDVGRVRDLTVVWIVARDGDTLKTVYLQELSGQSFSVQFDLLCELLTNKRIRRCAIDATGMGMQLAEQAVEKFGGSRVEAVTFTTAKKQKMAIALKLLVESRCIGIPQDSKLIADWHSVQRSVSGRGDLRFTASRQAGSHADRFWAAALAVHAGSLDCGEVDGEVSNRSFFARRGAW